MPLSGHNLGLNVWVEGGDLLFLIGGPNCLDENGMQVKLGLVRLSFEPALFAANFRQELNLARSEVVASGKTAAGQPASVTVWCAAGLPVVHAEVQAGGPVTVTAAYETWSAYAAHATNGGLQWVRRLPEENPRRLRDLKAQGMEVFAAAAPDPLSKLTLGGRLDAPGLVPAAVAPGKFNGMDTKVCAVQTDKPVRALDLTFTLRTEQDPSLAEWEARLARDAERAAKSAKADRAAALAWWADFWDRSHIVLKPGGSADDPGWQAGRNYQLIRYTMAANSSGRAMTLFNGGHFACSGNPDKRNWDGCQFMAQNQRLVYWPMLRAGDFDLLQVACDFYRDRTELRQLHAKTFWGVDGVTYPEPFSLFGLDAIGTTDEGRSKPSHLPYHYTSGMEFALMMLEMGRYTGKEFPRYREPALGILRYYDAYYQQLYQKRAGRRLDEDGRLVIYPSDACEPYHGCTNNTDVIAGLIALTRELLALPPGALAAEDRTYLEGFRQRIPKFTLAEKDGRTYYAAAKSWEWVFENGNMDFPQMYICFPFGIEFLGRGDMTLARNTWELSAIKPAVQHQNQCWYQSAINLARMGLAHRAADLTTRKLLHPGYRFPTFYHTHYAGGGSFCHTPDMDHGGVAMTALQEMLMQTDGRRILLAPAWPTEWDCDFKLHAPYQTVVEGRVKGGQVLVDKVTPEARRKDIEIFPPAPPPPTPVSQGRPATASSVWHQPGYDPAKAFDGDSVTRWAVANGQLAGWLAVDLGKTTAVSRAVIQEVSWPGITRFAIEAQQADGSWQNAATGTTIGAEWEVKFPPIAAQRFRLRIDAARIMPNIEEFQLFGP